MAASLSIQQLFGYANEFKEGDASLSLAAPSEIARKAARDTIGNLRLSQISSSDFSCASDDEVTAFSLTAIDIVQQQRTAAWTVSDLKEFLLAESTSGDMIKEVGRGLHSEAIAAVCKIMANAELKRVSAKVFNPLPNSSVGSQGYFGSRLQPNSPTDDPEEILMITLEGLSYGCGDVIIGINPVASDHASVRALEKCLRRIVDAFKLHDKTTYCVLAHIDDQAAVEDGTGLVQCLFQSIGGNSAINKTFNLSLNKLLTHLQKCQKQYFETGQGSASSNGVAYGVDMVTLESRAYGFARALKHKTGNKWTILNDVAGFIGPEVFRSPSQLLRACLEDVFMGKMHGMTMGLDICSTYHMGVSLEDIESVMNQVMESCPGYYMAVPGRNDPMLSYITTGFRDHAVLRKTHQRKVSAEMQGFFQEVGVMDERGELTEKAGDCAHMYLQFQIREGDRREHSEILKEAESLISKLQGRGLDIGYGHDGNFRMPKHIKDKLWSLYENAKTVIFESFTPAFETKLFPRALILRTAASSRQEYVLQPPTGEVLSEDSKKNLHAFAIQECQHFVQHKEMKGTSRRAVIILSDGLNPRSLETPDQATELVSALRNGLDAREVLVCPEIILHNGRVRGGYAVGQTLFQVHADVSDKEVRAETRREEVIGTVFHLIGERPGNGNNTYSVYISCVTASAWKKGITHDVVKVVSGISYTALAPANAALDCLAFYDLLCASLANAPDAKVAPFPVVPGSSEIKEEHLLSFATRTEELGRSALEGKIETTSSALDVSKASKSFQSIKLKSHSSRSLDLLSMDGA